MKGLGQLEGGLVPPSEQPIEFVMPPQEACQFEPKSTEKVALPGGSQIFDCSHYTQQRAKLIGEGITLRPGETAAISLDENTSTGYRWLA